MKRSVLVIAPYLPLPANFGGALRIYHLIRHVSEEHTVSLLAPGSETEFAALTELGEICNVTLVPADSTARQPASRHKRAAQLGSMVSGKSFLESGAYSFRMQAALDRLLNTRSIDIVQYEFPESALYRIPPAIPTVFDAHNIEHELLARIARTSRNSSKQIFNQLEARKVRRLEREIWSNATLCLATSERDAHVIRHTVSTPVDVVPNGVDLAAFNSEPLDLSEPGHVVFTGAMRHQPNADGARWYVERVHHLVQHNIPAAKFTIAGADPPAAVTALASDSVHVTGRVDDIKPYIQRARVVAVPLWSGSGTRLKVLEAFAAGRPVVSTTAGVEGIDAEHERHLLIADSPEAFAASVTRLCQDEGLSQELISNARNLVEDSYGWPAIANQLMASHERAIVLQRG